jgi:hypothetical protein
MHIITHHSWLNSSLKIAEFGYWPCSSADMPAKNHSRNQYDLTTEVERDLQSQQLSIIHAMDRRVFYTRLKHGFQLEPHNRLNQPADEVRGFVLSDFADLLASQAASACVCRRLYWAGVSPEVPNFHIPRRSALNPQNM